MTRTGRRALRGLTGILAFLLAWELFSRAGVVREEFLPPASTVLARLAQLSTDAGFVADVVATLLAWLIALALAVAVAVPAGLVLGSVPAVASSVRVLVEFLRPIPSVALIPLVVILLGTGPETKISLAVYAAVWPLLFNTVYAMGEVDPLLTETARAFRLSRTRTLLTVSLPHAAPFVVTGIRISAAIALIVLISTELLTAGGGIGQYIYLAGSGGGRMDVVLAGTFVAGLMGYLANAGFERVQRRHLAWGSGSAP